MRKYIVPNVNSVTDVVLLASSQKRSQTVSGKALNCIVSVSIGAEV
jgi:hypothetical protein